MSKILIDSSNYSNRQYNKEEDLLISEFFCDTIQGEGIYIGYPATFLRLQNCVLNCDFCDSTEVWRKGSPYNTGELINLMESSNLLHKFTQGQHLVITGGSPLLQQKNLSDFLGKMMQYAGWQKPFIEIENECVIMPSSYMMSIVDCWNNSPKLSNSGIKRNHRYKPEVIAKISSLKNSWFKFVVAEECHWQEIKEDYIDKDLIKKSQIILMPQGADQKELEMNREFVVNVAVRENVRYSSREHIVLWNRKLSV